MCWLCDENDGEPVGCQNCGCMICDDVEQGDDVIRPAYVTSSGDLFCNRCGPDYEDDDWEDDGYDYRDDDDGE